ncbi:MAG: MG2 domain-containing protein [Bryobacteraceae bacterium]|nr:MG2 domain-containing protein [Bryobacteraceae bacterium]
MRVRDLARMQFTPENRARIRAWRQKQERPRTPAEAAPAFAGVPVLNPDQLVKRWTQTVRGRQPWEMITLRVPLPEAGVYVLEATDQQKQAYVVLLATRLTAIAKAHENRLALRVVDRTSGEPRSGCAAEVLALAEKRSPAAATTDSHGAGALEWNEAREESPLLLVKCGEEWASAVIPAQSYPPGWRGLTGALHTDRPVYRPGQKVRFRAILRESRGGDYALPVLKAVRVTVENPEGNPVYQKTIPLSRYGTVSGEFDLPPDAPLGYFGIRAGHEEGMEAVYGGFHVEEYRKPEYEVKVRPSAARGLQGVRMEARIEARYYYGEPVSGAAVQWSVHRYRWYPPWWEWEDEEPEEIEQAFGGEQILEEKGQLDAEGKLTVSFPLERGDHDYLYRIEAQVADEGGRTISGTASFVGTRANFLLTARPERWVYGENETVKWVVSAVDFDQKPVARVPFRLEVYRTKDGRRFGTPVLARSGVTGADGEGVAEFPAPGSGAWAVVTTASPPQGELVEEGWLWVSGEWSGGPLAGRVRITLDRTAYRPGETAKALVVTGVPRADVWLTVEAAGIHLSRFLRVEGGAATVELPVETAWIPNVFVEAVFVHADRLFQGSRVLRVPPVEKQIFVELEPSKKEFQPGEPASLRLTARDHEGRPLQAEFALGVVDEAIYAIRREAQPDLVRLFYGRRWNRVQTSTSLSYYFWGHAGTRRMELARRPSAPFRAQLKPEQPSAPRVRKEFPDTAFWVAHLETDAQGRAEVRFAFPDSLTTWRATARGVTLDTRVGSAVQRVLVRKDVVVSIAAPRFLNEGDETVVPVLARNYTGQPLRARISLRASGVRILEGGETEAEIQPQGEARVDYRLRAESPGQAVLTAAAAAAGGSDAVEIPLPVRPYGIPMSAAAEARLDNTASATLVHDFPASAGASSRVAEIRLAPSLAGSLFGALEYLLEYPYGCTEQLMSSLLPNLVVAESLRRLKLEASVNRRELDRNVLEGLERLYAQQNEDGGWGWWHEEESSIFLTSYVLLGLGYAEESGYRVDAGRRGRAEGWLKERLASGGKADPDEWACALLALSRRGRLDPLLAGEAWARRAGMTGFGLAALGLALDNARDSRRNEAAGLLMKAATQEGEEMFWPSRRDPMFLHDSEHTFEATAMAVRFLAAAAPESPAVDRAVRWLMNHRQRGYYWGNTKRTAFVIYGLAPLLERSGQLRPDLTARVLAGGREVSRKRFTAEDALAARPLRIAVPVSGARSEIRVETEGRGTLYVSANWSWRRAEILEAGRMPETGRLRIERRYYRLRRADAGGRIEYELEPWTGPARRGDLVAVHVRAFGLDRMNAYVLEDPLPAGAEPVGRDMGLRLRRVPEWWRWWTGRRELRDDRVAWFPWWIPERGYDAVYLLRFTNAGRYRAAPARLEPMYEPGVMAWSEAAQWEVLP